MHQQRNDKPIVIIIHLITKSNLPKPNCTLRVKHENKLSCLLEQYALLQKEEVLTVPGSRSVAIGKTHMWLRLQGWVFSREKNRKIREERE